MNADYVEALKSTPTKYTRLYWLELYVLAIGVIFYGGFDLLSTLVAVETMGTSGEANPLMRMLLEHVGGIGLLIVKPVIFALLGYYWARGRVELELADPDDLDRIDTLTPLLITLIVGILGIIIFINNTHTLGQIASYEGVTVWELIISA